MLKRISLFALLALLFVNAGCDRHRVVSSHLKEKGSITVAMDVDMPGYFVLGGESYGYQYDLLKAYADYLDVDMDIVPESSPQACARLLESGEVDIVATLTSHVGEEMAGDAMEVYNTSYVILARKALVSSFAKEEFSLGRALGGRKLMVSEGFKASDNYRALLDSLSGTSVYLSSKSSFDLMERLSAGDYDYLICEKSEAQLGVALVRNIGQVYAFTEPVSMSVVLSGSVGGLKEDFGQWLEGYRNGEEYAMLNDLYFEKGIVGQLIGKGARKVLGGISAYDDLIREVSEQEGHDWRMLSAIAYSESRFNAFIVSRRGARGLMQIMPVVARQFNIGEGEIMKPETNVMLAAKLLNKIERTLKLPRNMPYEDRMSLILACYNGGIGHVIDARKLTAKYGGNPNSWTDVSVFLQKKADPLYVEDDVVKHGRFTGSGETLAFVDKVMGKYRSYCNAVKL